MALAEAYDPHEKSHGLLPVTELRRQKATDRHCNNHCANLTTTPDAGSDPGSRSPKVFTRSSQAKSGKDAQCKTGSSHPSSFLWVSRLASWRSHLSGRSHDNAQGTS